jgi:hypothetical protein
MGEHLDHDALQAIATAAGLTGLKQEHLEQLHRAIASARELSDKLPKDLAWSDELALCFGLAPAADDKP